jgi:hypothetical protein
MTLAIDGATAAAIYVPDRTGTLLPLDEWRRIMQLHPWHFWQLANNVIPLTSSCFPLTLEHAWQNAQAVGRAEIVEAIISAERKFHQVFGFSPSPRAEYDEVQVQMYYDRRNTYLSSADAQGRWLALNTLSKKIMNVGKLGLSFIGTSAVSYSDIDGDGLSEMFTLSISTSITDPDQIAVYFSSADRYDSGNGNEICDRWRVQPVSVSIASGTATIKGRAWTVVKPVKYQGYSQNEIDPFAASNFVSTLDVYQRAVDTTVQGDFVWETSPSDDCETCDVSDNTLDPSAVATLNARYVVRDSDIGTLAGEVAYYDDSCDEWITNGWPVAYAPERARIHYTAGYPLERGQMAEQMKIIVARLAAAELAQPVCGCDSSNRQLAHWQQDLSRQSGAQDADTYQVAFEDLSNPFGTRRGHVFAWRQLRDLVRERGISTA